MYVPDDRSEFVNELRRMCSIGVLLGVLGGNIPKSRKFLRLSKILGCESEIFITYLYKKRTLYFCKNVLFIFP